MIMKFYGHYLIYKYIFNFSLFCTTYKLNDKKNHLNFKGNFYF